MIEIARTDANGDMAEYAGWERGYKQTVLHAGRPLSVFSNRKKQASSGKRHREHEGTAMCKSEYMYSRRKTDLPSTRV